MEEAYVSTSPLQSEFSECISISCATTWAIWNATLSFWVYIEKECCWNLAPPPQVVHTMILGFFCCDSYFYFYFFGNWKPYFNSSAVYVYLSSSWLCIKAPNLLAMSFLLSFLISEGDQMSDFDCWPVFNFFCLVANSLFECLFWQVLWRWMTGPRCHLSIYCDISLYKGVSASSGVRNNLWNKSAGLKIYRRAF